MPGMMDTVLNLGLNDEVVAGLAVKSGERFAYDSYRRFLDMFGDVVSSSSSCFQIFSNNWMMCMKPTEHIFDPFEGDGHFPFFV